MGLRPKTLPDGRNPLYAWDYRNQMEVMIEDDREDILSIDFNDERYRTISAFHRIPCEYVFNQPREVQNAIMNSIMDFIIKDCEIYEYKRKDYKLKREAVEKAYLKGIKKAGMSISPSLRARRVRFIFDSERLADKFVERYECLCSTPSPKGGLEKVHRFKRETYRGRGYTPPEYDYIVDLFLTGKNRDEILKCVEYKIERHGHTWYRVEHFK